MRQRRIASESQLDHVFSMVNAYANLAGYIEKVDELETVIEQKYREAVESDPEFEQFTPLFGPFVPRSEIVASSGAWIGQHLFQTRAYCVGNKVVFQGGGFFRSPLVNQIINLGATPRKAIAYEPFLNMAKAVGFSKRLDGLYFDQSRQQILVLKTTTVARIKELRGDVDTSQFDLFSNGDWLAVATLPSKPVAALTLSQGILSNAFPDLRVRTFLLILDSDQWRFELREATDTPFQKLKRGVVAFGDLPVVRMTLQTHNSAFDVQEYRHLPRLPVKDRLDALPVNRATRSAMILRSLWERQSPQNSLAIVSVPEIAKAVTTKHLIVYPDNLLRHDIEDCLVPNEFVERPRYDKKGYALTPAGVMASLMIREQLIERMGAAWTIDIEDAVLAPIRRQGRFWAKYKMGIQRE